MPSWDDLRFLLAVARAGSLSAAGRQLGVDQSTVGRRVATLERTVGARLFARTTDGYVLTPAGASVLEDVAAIEERITSVARRLAGDDARLEGRVRVTASETFAVSFLPRHLGSLRRLHPGILLDIVPNNQILSLANREADIAIRVGSAPRHSNLIARRLGHVAVAPYAHARYLAERGRPRVARQYKGHDIVRFDEALTGGPASRWIQARASAARVVLVSSSFLALVTAVQAALGIGVLPCWLAALDRELHELAPGVVERPDLWLVIHEDMKRNARVRAVTDFIVELFKREGASLRHEDR